MVVQINRSALTIRACPKLDIHLRLITRHRCWYKDSSVVTDTEGPSPLGETLSILV